MTHGAFLPFWEPLVDFQSLLRPLGAFVLKTMTQATTTTTTVHDDDDGGPFYFWLGHFYFWWLGPSFSIFG